MLREFARNSPVARLHVETLGSATVNFTFLVCDYRGTTFVLRDFGIPQFDFKPRSGTTSATHTSK